jgi:hypothetical protein
VADVEGVRALEGAEPEVNYEYSYTTERPLGRSHEHQGKAGEKVRYRGRCACGRQTHMTYSTPGIAINAIRFVHNPDIPGEEHAA